MKILVHAGFHKTGTSTLQRTAEHNKDVLCDRMQLLLPPDLSEVGHLARRISIKPGKRKDARFSDAFRTAIEDLRQDDTRPLLISNEDLAGIIPGRRNVWTYDSAPSIANLVALELFQTFGEKIDLTFWFTTRRAAGWMESVYWQNLRSNRITREFAEYRPMLKQAADLDRIVLAVRDRLAGYARVCSTDIRACVGPLGPLSVALDLLGVSQHGLKPLGKQNVQPRDGAQTLLEMNRSAMNDEHLAIAKRQYLRSIRKGPVES